MQHAIIQQALAPLIGLPMSGIGRAADLLWIHFGELRELPNRRGGIRTAGEYALHVQCPWRLTRPPKILIGYGDQFREAGNDDPCDPNASHVPRFDRCLLALNRDFESLPPQVQTVVVDAVGGFSVEFSGDLYLEVFPGDITDREHWRILKPGHEESHFVFPEDLSEADE